MHYLPLKVQWSLLLTRNWNYPRFGFHNGFTFHRTFYSHLIGISMVGALARDCNCGPRCKVVCWRHLLKCFSIKISKMEFKWNWWPTDRKFIQDFMPRHRADNTYPPTYRHSRSKLTFLLNFHPLYLCLRVCTYVGSMCDMQRRDIRIMKESRLKEDIKRIKGAT